MAMHPIETTNYILPTLAIKDLYDAIREWVEARCPGGIIWGYQRMGKTRGIPHLRFGLASEWPNLFTFDMRCRTYRVSGEGIFFSDLLSAANHAIPETGSPLEKRNRLIEFLADKAISSGEHRLVLFIDEAQRLTEIQFEWLMDVHNDLDKRGVSFIVLLVGQPELAQRKEAYCEAGQMQIVGRFMVHSRRFKGLTSAKDVRHCLREYDKAEFPKGSGCSFSRHYFPRAWDHGWRLENHAQEFWDAIKSEADALGLDSVDEVPMAYFTRMVNILLTKYGERAVADPEITISCLKDIVKRSNCMEALDAMSKSKRDRK